jgi:hypothetical protein
MWKIGYAAQEGSSNAVSDEVAASNAPHTSSHADTSPASSSAAKSKGSHMYSLFYLTNQLLL